MNKLRNLTILLGSTMTVLAGAILAPVLPEMSSVFQDVNNAEFLVRLTLTLPALFIVIAAPFMGSLLDSWGRKPVLITSLIIYGIAGTSGYITDSLTGILIGRAILGIAVAGIMSGFTTLIADYFSEQNLNKFMGYQAAFIGGGGMIFILVAGYLAEFGWKFPFLLYLFAFIILPGVLFTIKEPEIKKSTIKGKFQIKMFMFIYVISFVGMIVFFTFPVQLPFYLALAGTSSTKIGLALSLQTLTSILGALLFTRLRLSFSKVFIIIFLLFGINHLIVGSSEVYGIIIIGLLIGGFGLGMLPPNLQVWVAKTASPAVRGRAMSGFTAALFLGQFFTPIVTQPIVQKAGLATMFSVIGIISIFIAIFFIGKVILKKKNVSISK